MNGFKFKIAVNMNNELVRCTLVARLRELRNIDTRRLINQLNMEI